MKRILLAALTLSSCAAPPPYPAENRPMAELTGHAPVSPQRCVPFNQPRSLRVSDSDRHALLYGSGRTVWVNQLASSCGFGADDVLVTEPDGATYFRGDIIQSFDRFSRIPGPSCVLGDFVPFSR